MPLLLSPLLLFLSRSEIPAPSAPLSQPPSTFLPPPLASALSFAFRPPFYSRRRSSLLPLNLRRHLLSLLHSHPCRHFSLLPSCFFPTAAPVSAAAAAVVATEPRPDPGYTVVNAVMEKEDGLGCRCVHTLTVVPVVGEEGSPDYIGPQLILFGGATTLEGNSATPPSSAGSAGIRLVGVTADVHYYDVLSILLQECTLFDIFDCGPSEIKLEVKIKTRSSREIIVQAQDRGKPRQNQESNHCAAATRLDKLEEKIKMSRARSRTSSWLPVGMS